MLFLKTLWHRWRIAWAVARLRRAGVTGDPAAVAEAAAELKALVELIAERLGDHRVKWAAAAVATAADRLVGDGP